MLGGWRGSSVAHGNRPGSLLPLLSYAVGELRLGISGLFCASGPLRYIVICRIADVLERFSSNRTARAYGLWLVVANLAALGATYSLANGTLLWPILIAAAILLRLKLPRDLEFRTDQRHVSCGLYFFHYTRPRWHADPHVVAARADQPLEVFGRIFRKLMGQLHYSSGGLLGVAGLAIALAVILGLPVLR